MLKEKFSDEEQRILLAALGKEMAFVEKSGYSTLIDIVNSICKKIFGQTYYEIVDK